MSVPRQCPSCRSVVEEGDQFCPSCGRRLAEAHGTGRPEGSACPLCGQVNPATAQACTSCGAKLRDIAGPTAAAGERPHTTKGIGAFQSWKFTLGIGAILVVALIVLVTAKKSPETEPVSPAAVQGDPHADPRMGRLRELQAAVQNNPKDTAATLEFANLLYDVGFFERAAEMYDRYLAMAPGNADARVDLGTAWYNMALADSAKRGVLIAKAESYFQQVVRSAPRHQMAHFNLGIVRLQEGDMPGARDWFERCVAIDSTTAIADRARELLSEHVSIKK